MSTGAPIPQFSTEEGVLVGTPRFVSPEQARGRGVDYRTDIYAVGLVLYTLVAGRDPFGEVGQDLIRRRALAVDEPVREAAAAFPYRLEGDRDHGRRERGEESVALAADEGADTHDDRRVDDGDEDGERAVHHRPVDHDVDLVEAVLEHRDRDRREQEDEGDALEHRDPCRRRLALREVDQE